MVIKKADYDSLVMMMYVSYRGLYFCKNTIEGKFIEIFNTYNVRLNLTLGSTNCDLCHPCWAGALRCVEIVSDDYRDCYEHYEH